MLPAPLRSWLQANPRLRRAVVALTWLALGVYFLFGAIFLSLRYFILPHVADYRVDIEKALSGAMGLPVAIQTIEADWQGARPRLAIHGMSIRDRQGRTALAFDEVEAVLGWTTLLTLEPRLHRLEIHAPSLAVRRDGSGHLFVAGLAVDTKSSEPGFADWVLRQHQIVVRDAAVTWSDELRQAPPLTLDRLNLNLENVFGHHRFGFTAEPPKALASRLELRGDLRGRDLSALDGWAGQLYAQLDSADLAGWRPWVNYPVDLPRGQGGLRLWLDVAQLQAQAATADVSLNDVAVRLAPSLPMLELKSLSGRLRARLLEGGFELETRGLALATNDGLAIAPTDALVSWQPKQGAFKANGLDFVALARLADYLPLPAAARAGLLRHAPKGRLRDFNLEWNGAASPFEHYQVRGRFDDLAWNGDEQLPGGSGLSGSVDGNERSGHLNISFKNGALDLPMVFPEPHLALDTLEAEVSWKQSGDGLDINLNKAQFRNADADGSASGHYLHRAGKPGVIDLDGRLNKGQGTAVWRYMPKVVGEDARVWLHDALQGGEGHDVTLKLKGDLGHFPFTDGSGVFRVQGRFSGATLKYGGNWPQIDHIVGDLLFEGTRMRIQASSGSILGATVGPVTAEIPDLLAPEEMLIVKGKAKGPTPSFLRFIEASPVGERIDHFTEDMAASGNGELDLHIELPLRHLANATVAGGYRFDGNKVTVDADIPPLEDVRGRIEFSHAHLAAKDIRAKLLGGPMALDIKTQGDGQVAVDVHGELSVAQMRQQLPAALLERLSGGTRWEGTIRVKKRNPEVRITSDLRGLSSSLPEPFNKSAVEARSFVFERKLPDAKNALRRARSGGANRDQIDLSLGRGVRMQLLRSGDGGPMRVEQGVLALGNGVATPRMPEQGLAIAVAVPRIDLDLWRAIGSDNRGGKGAAAGLAIAQLDLRSDELVAFGRVLHELRVNGGQKGERLALDTRSREISGHFDWYGAGKGRLSGRIGQFSLPAQTVSSGNVSEQELDALPALDLIFDRFVFIGRDLGELRIAAENRGGYWNANFKVNNEDGSLDGSGRWRPSVDLPDTQIEFQAKAKSIEKLLARIGYVNAVKRGSASLDGKLSWNGPPYAFDYPSMNGSVRFEAKDGQFNKLEPGVGRLLGIISLQSLPRRITLDFRDIFSEGFAFDAIKGKAEVTRGVLKTDDLEIQGPAARVEMQGTVDLAKETQNLRVRVQPALGETVATGVLLAHPVTGAGVWVFNKLFGNPLDKIFAFEYAVSGAWADPKVEKIGGGVPKEAAKEAKKEATP
ncbi:MAG TPA: YhdP family protein [Rhodocyclaceae bacterium]